MKATLHIGKNGSANHNDRQFDPKVTGDNHIDPDRMINNIYSSYKNIIPFAEAEKAFYTDSYSEWIEMQNKKYLQHREAKKQKSISKLLTGRNTRPDEIILQIGNQYDHPSEEKFAECVNEFIKSLAPYAQNFHVIDYAIHNDEATPHVHIRAVWDYINKDGIKKISQGKALEQLNIGLPYPELEEGRFNNRKITFQKEIREKWYDICEEKGLEIDREPIPGNDRHLNKNELTLREQEKKIQEKERYLQEIDAAIQQKQLDLERINQELEKEEDKRQKKAQQLAKTLGLE